MHALYLADLRITTLLYSLYEISTNSKLLFSTTVLPDALLSLDLLRITLSRYSLLFSSIHLLTLASASTRVKQLLQVTRVRPLCLRVKTVSKITRNSSSVFSNFSVIFVLFGKYGNRYKNRIWCRVNRSEYGWTSIPSVFRLVGKNR
jgi:hypothetical protein